MSPLGRFVRLQAPASRRTISYFSSKSGGRYFNSTKSPKAAAVVTAKASKPKTDDVVAQDGAAGNVQTTAPPVSPVEQSTSASASTQPTDSASSSPATASKSSEAKESSTTPAAPAASSSKSLADAFAELTSLPPTQSISAKDFKIHQFFSLHRPLLLVSQPSSIFRPVPEGFPLVARPQHPSASQIGIDGGLKGQKPDITLDADAEAARQLTRALMMNKAGGVVDWETTLKTLGLDVSKEADRVGLKEKFEKEWEEVLLDSTKRKRRKKMKKHKLKKRRRATRSERLRMKQG